MSCPAEIANKFAAAVKELTGHVHEGKKAGEPVEIKPGDRYVGGEGKPVRSIETVEYTVEYRQTHEGGTPSLAAIGSEEIDTPTFHCEWKFVDPGMFTYRCKLNKCSVSISRVSDELPAYYAICPKYVFLDGGGAYYAPAKLKGEEELRDLFSGEDRFKNISEKVVEDSRQTGQPAETQDMIRGWLNPHEQEFRQVFAVVNADKFLAVCKRVTC